MRFFLDYLKGVALGAGAILPGISSGVLCVIFGIYDKLIDSILHFFKNIKENLVFLLPILSGVATGVILFGKILLFLFDKYKMPTCFAFIGLIIGCIPILAKQANGEKGFRLHYLVYSCISFFFAVFLIILEKSLPMKSFFINDTPNNIFLIFSGFVMSIGVVIPGVSNTVLLMLLRCLPNLPSSSKLCEFANLVSYGNWVSCRWFCIFKTDFFLF